MFQILDGKKLANKILAYVQKEIKLLPHKPRLLVFLMGRDKASQIFTREKERACSEVGVEFFLVKIKASLGIRKICQIINAEIREKSPDGVMIQLPLPKDMDLEKILQCLPPNKDVDGFLGEGLTSPVARGIVALLSEYKIKLKDCPVAVVGAGRLVGQPVSRILKLLGAKVKVCDIKTPHLAQETRKAEILISGVGKPNLIKGDMVKKGAVVVDAGFKIIRGRIKGDVDFEAVKKKASSLTPVPGGVGPMTVAMLLVNLVELAKSGVRRKRVAR